MAQKEHTCRNCLHLVPGQNKNGKRLVTKNQSYLCAAPIPILLLPDSITKAYGWQELESYRKRVWADAGQHCPLWHEIPKG